jgi:hypothetical protein
MQPAASSMPTPDYREVIQALREEGAPLDGMLAVGSNARWRQPTRGTGWDGSLLVAPMGRTIRALAEYVATPFR